MMLLPTQQASATLVTSMVQSIVDDIEKRRVEEEEKLSGKEDKVVKAQVRSDDVSKAANAKINEHFFGALKRDENPLATLIARFTGAVGLSQETGESSDDFATRLQDALVFVQMIDKDAVSGKMVEPVSLARFGVSATEIAEINAGTAENPSDMALTLARFAKENGLEQASDETDDAFSSRIGASLTAYRKTLAESIPAIEKKTGLTELGITAEQMIEAIRRPYGAQAEAIEAILDDKATEEKTLTADVSKVLQRLEDIADPKTIEELKAERLAKDPTKVEDAETRKEREETIDALEAGEKLEDVQDLHEAIRKGNEAATKNGGAKDTVTGETAETIAIEAIQVLAAGAEIAQTQAEAPKGDAKTSALSQNDESTGEVEPPSDTEQAVMLARAGQADATKRDEEAQKGILSVTIDENGIYDLLAKKEAA
ncbi:hypothetical protein [Pararhizobium sp. O133]|uniref:hypothetical protein n=1 Tax=Pararhizobium sp. O133 TaxID=3449278 RepID=UPI003F687FE3